MPSLENSEISIATNATSNCGSYLIISILRKNGTTGVQSHINSLLNGLRSLGAQAHFLNAFSYYKFLYYPIYALRPLFLERNFKSAAVWWHRYWHYVFLSLSLRKFLKINKVDVINAQCPLSALAALNIRKANGYGFKVVLTCHFNISQAEEFYGKGEIPKGGKVYNAIVSLETKVLERVDGVVFVSDFSSKQITKFHHIEIPNPAVIHNGSAFLKQTGSDLRNRLGIKSTDFVIICVGTLEPRKNQKFLLPVMEQLLAEDSSYVLILVGDGQDRPEIESAVKKINLQKSVRVLGYRRDVNVLMSISDVYCHPAKMENFSVAIVEAFSVGLPVIASPVGGATEIVEHGKNGFLIDTSHSNVTEYVNRIKELKNDKEIYLALSEHAQETYRSRFTEEAMCKRFLSFFQGASGCAAKNG